MMSSILELYQAAPSGLKSRVGELYRGRHKALGTPVLIKEIDAQQHPEAWGQFQQIYELVHENIAQVIDLREDNGHIYLVLEDYREESVTNRLQPVRGSQLKQWAYELIQALSCMHSHSVRHRNISVASIQFCKGHPILTNFEFTEGVIPPQSEEEKSESTTTRIPSSFDDPEIVSTGTFENPASDVYSLGRVLLCFATGSSTASNIGQYDFKSESFKELICAMTADDSTKRESAESLLEYPFFHEPVQDEQIVELLPLVDAEDIGSLGTEFWNKFAEDTSFMIRTKNPRGASYSLMLRYRNPSKRPGVIRDTNPEAMAKIATESIKAAVVYQYSQLYPYACYCYRRAVLATIIGTQKTEDVTYMKQLQMASKANLDELESRWSDKLVTVHS